MSIETQGQKKPSAMKSIVSGGITGAIEICITYPTEFVKTYMQLYPKQANQGIKHCLSTIYKDNGILGFYKGLQPLVIMSAPKTAVRFGSNTWLKNNVFKEHKTSKLQTFMAGLGAGITEAIFVVTPSETIKVKLVHDIFQEKPKYRGLIHGTSMIIREAGLGGIYKGLFPTILKQGSNQGIRFLVYDEFRKFFKQFGMNDTMNSLISGGFAGAASVFANTPIDVIKTKMQSLDASKYSSSWDCVKKTVQSDGISGLYKGTIPRLSRVVLDVGITFALFEQINIWLNRVWKH